MARRPKRKCTGGWSADGPSTVNAPTTGAIDPARWRGSKKSRRFMELLRAPLELSRASLLVDVVDHRLEVLGVALDRQHDRPLLDAVGARRDRRDDLPPVRQAEAHREGAVRPQFHRLALQRHAGVRLGGAVDNQFGVESEPELA